MAYSLPSLNAAGNYLASYRQVQPVAGFEDVLSTSGVDTFARQQELEFAAQVGMAKQALNNLTQRLINEDNIKYYEGRDDKTLKTNKLLALAGLTGGRSRSSSSGGSNSLLGPMDELIGFNTKTDQIYGRVNDTQALEDAISSLGVNTVFDNMTGQGSKSSSSQKSAPQASTQSLDLKTTTPVFEQLIIDEMRRRQSGK